MHTKSSSADVGRLSRIWNDRQIIKETFAESAKVSFFSRFAMYHIDGWTNTIVLSSLPVVLGR